MKWFTYLHDHLPPGLVPLPVVCLLLELLLDPLSTGSVLKGKLADDTANFAGLRFFGLVRRSAEVGQEPLEPEQSKVKDSSVDQC